MEKVASSKPTHLFSKMTLISVQFTLTSGTSENRPLILDVTERPATSEITTRTARAPLKRQNLVNFFRQSDNDDDKTTSETRG